VHCRSGAVFFAPTIEKKIEVCNGSIFFYAKKNGISNPDVINGGMDKVNMVVIAY